MLEEGAEVTTEELQEAVAELKKLNQEKFLRLNSMRVNSQQMTLDPTGVMLTRLEALVDFLLDDRMKLLFEYKFEAEIGGQLEDALSEVTRMQLLEGVSGIDNNSPFRMPGR